MKEKRKYPRLDFQLKLNFNKKGKSVKNLPAITKNISAGGLRFTSDQKLSPGSKVGFEMKLPNNDKPVSFAGKVIWSKTLASAAKGKEKIYDIGIKFTDNCKISVKYLKPSGNVAKIKPTKG